MRFSLNTIGLFPGLSFEQIFPRMRQSGFDTFELWSLENVDTAALRQAMDRLEPRERQIITMRFGLDGRPERTQKEVADQLGISQSYISRLEKRIIARLKKEIVRMM